MLCKFGGREGRTDSQNNTSAIQVRKFLWTQVQRQPRVLSPLSGLRFSAWSIPERTRPLRLLTHPVPHLGPDGIFHFAPFANINQGPGPSTVDSLSREEQAVSGLLPRAPAARLCWDMGLLGAPLPWVAL